MKKFFTKYGLFAGPVGILIILFGMLNPIFIPIEYVKIALDASLTVAVILMILGAIWGEGTL